MEGSNGSGSCQSSHFCSVIGVSFLAGCYNRYQDRTRLVICGGLQCFMVMFGLLRAGLQVVWLVQVTVTSGNR